MVYIKKTNKTEKTAKIYVPYEKRLYKRAFMALACKAFRYCSSYSLDRKSCSRLSCISASG